jgi:hypothetical protein
MKVPAIHGYMERRILINYTVDPNVAAKLIPSPFRPKIYKDKAIVGICLIRLKSIKPKGLPDWLGIASENGAHRFAVEWDENGTTKEGVYIPRRDTSSYINNLAGGRLFPGRHYKAKFDVHECNGNYTVSFISSDNTSIAIEAREGEFLSPLTVFNTLEDASCFFQNGAIGYSPDGGKFDGIKLNTYKWSVKPLDVIKVESSFFNDRELFPEGSIQFDNALLMKGVEHEWQSVISK